MVSRIHFNLMRLLTVQANMSTDTEQNPSRDNSLDCPEDAEGFDNEIIPPEHNFECPICMMCLRDPYQTDCGHRFCKNCIKRWLRVNGSKRQCPACNEMLTHEKVYPDNYAKREVYALKANCTYKKQGCEEQAPLKAILHHQGECTYRPVACPHCQKSIMRKDLDEHVSKECPKQTIECKSCHHQVQRCNLETHKRICSTATNSCPDCGDVLANSTERNERATHACPTGIVKCRFNKFGCSYECPATNMRMHLEQNQQEHLLCLASVVERLMRDSEHPLLPELCRLDSQVQHLKADGASGRKSLDAANVNDDLKKPAIVRTLSLTSGGDKYSTCFPAGDNNVESGEVVLQLRNQLANQQQHILELRSKVNFLENSLHDSRLEMRDMKAEFKNRSCQGNFVWRVKNYQKLRMEAKMGAPNTVIHSPGFYSSFNGYQFCIRLNLNGVENARGSHLSLFIHLMQSDNDDILPWPFTGKVTLSICDQHEVATKRNPITETLLAKPGLAAFQRPTSFRNHKGFGYMEFAPISFIENAERCFIKDDTLLIRAEIRSNAPT